MGNLFSLNIIWQKKKVIKSKNIDIIYCYNSFDNIGNSYTKVFFSRNFYFLPFGNFFEKINQLNSNYRGYEKSTINFGISKDHVLYKSEFEYEEKIIDEFKSNNKPLFKFKDYELKKGNNILNKFNINEDDKIILFQNRDDGFLNYIDRNKDWSYHNYRDSDPKKMIKSMIYLADKGYKVFRCGKVIKEKLNLKHKNIFEYSRSELFNDFMDYYLAYRSNFFVCSDSGFSNLAILFKKPIVSINYASISRVRKWMNFEIKIFKKFIDIKKNKLLSITDLKSLDLDKVTRTEQINNKQIKIEENSEDEIFEAVKEMEFSLNNNWKIFKENYNLQKNFWQKLDYKRIQKIFTSAIII